MENEQNDEFAKVKAFVQEILEMCEDKGLSVFEVMRLPAFLEKGVRKQVSINNSKNRFVKY